MTDGQMATIVIFPGIRYERLDDAQAVEGAHPVSRKKPSARRKKVTG